jgi:4-amino-4-deoxy-L-arabinose transferase-like glycosyltransferase
MMESSARLRLVLVSLLVLIVPVFLVALGANSIWDHNEAFYVETPRQMILRGDYITPYFNDATRLNKPVLSYWIVAGLYHLFGVSVTAERLGIAVGALVIMAAAFMTGRALRSTTTGLLAVLVVATAPRVVMHSRRIFIDVYITAFMSLTLAFFVLAERYPHHRRKALVAMYTCIGLGMLTKGPIALVLPAAIAAVWFTMERRWSALRSLMLPAGALITLTIVAPWYIALYFRHGWEPIAGFFLGENVDRYLTPMADDRRSFLFYVQVLLTDLFPWAPLALVPLATAWRRPQPAHAGADTAALRRLLWCWTLVIVGAFSLSATKQDLYILPITVAVAVLIADLLVTTGFGVSSRVVRWLIFGTGGLTTGAGLAIGALFSSGVYALSGGSMASAVLVVGGAVVAAASAWRRMTFAAVALAATFGLFNYVFVMRVLPSVERFKPSPLFAATIAQNGAPHDRVGSYDYMLSSLVYYAARPVAQFGTPPELEEFVADGHGWVVMRRELYDVLKAELPALCVAASGQAFNPTLGEMISRTPPAEIVLVRSGCP